MQHCLDCREIEWW